ncbi:MAG: ABC transporter ATP-binding protein [Bacilli bacterium]
MQHAIVVENASKRFRLYKNTNEKLKDLILGNRGGKFHSALTDVSFNVDHGEILGVIGVNGSGKSTLSNLIAGVSMPTEGNVEINGKATLLSIGAGLNSQMTGIENVELKALMLGYSKQQLKDLIPKVEEFADIGEFIHQPLKTYSSGMKSRLGFAISINVDPDILIIDEALSVGDRTFTDKCLAKIQEFKQKGKTIIFISHSLSQVQKFCTKVLWLHKGRNVGEGDSKPMIAKYNEFVNEYQKCKGAADRQQLEQELFDGRFRL